MINVGHHRDIVVSFAQALFVHADVVDGIKRPSIQPSLHCSFDQAMNAIPTQPEEFSGTRDVGCRLQNTNGESFKHHRESRVLAGPRNRDGFDSAGKAIASRNRCSDLSRELHRVEMPPGSLGCGVASRARRRAFGTAELATGMLQVNDDLVGGEIEVNVDNFPIVAEPKK